MSRWRFSAARSIIGLLLFGGLLPSGRAGEGRRCAAQPGESAPAYDGGALVLGSGERLPRVIYNLDIHVEDGFARTTIDQVYFNTRSSRQEGRFRFPLPRGASISRLAMYVGEQKMEAGMVERERAAGIYRGIVRKKKDPVLLEWEDGRTFNMRVFPVEPRSHKRIIISYTQRLDQTDEGWRYSFPGATGESREWSARVSIKSGAQRDWRCGEIDWEDERKDGDLLLEAGASSGQCLPAFAIALANEERGAPRFEFVELGEETYAMLRWRPDVGTTLPHERQRTWIVLFEASADRDPVMARLQIDALREFKAKRPEDGFAVVVANTETEFMGGEGVFDALETVDLIGALDLERAFRHVGSLAKGRKAVGILHLGAGFASLGERNTKRLVEILPEGVPYVGAGIGGEVNRELMTAAAQRSGGVFGELTSASQLSSLARGVPGGMITKLGASSGVVRFLVTNQTVQPGEEIFAVARIPEGVALPGNVVLSGKLDGEKWERGLRANWSKADAGYLPRAWARLEIERLLGLGEGRRMQIVGLSKAMYVMSPYTSLLVLENEAMHKEHRVERGRADHWAMYPAPERMALLPALEEIDKPAPNRAREPWQLVPAGEPDWEEMPLTFPKPMFVGTPVRVERPNLEGKGLGWSSGLAWRPTFAGKGVEITNVPTYGWGKPRVSLRAPRGTTLISRDMPVTAGGGTLDIDPIIGELEMITNGDKSGAAGSYVELGGLGLEWVQIDLERAQELWAIHLWHFHKHCRAYDDVIVQLSNDPDFRVGVRTVFNNDFDNSAGMGVGSDPAWVETNHGRIIDVPGVVARYVRLYSNGNTANELNHYVEVEVWGRQAGGRLAGGGDNPVREGVWDRVARLEREAETRWEGSGGRVDLRWLRRSHAAILGAMSDAIAANEPPPADAVERARRIGDRWWGIDGGSEHACEVTAEVMRLLGRDDLRWKYLTTPVALAGGRAHAWRSLARRATLSKDPILERLAMGEADRAGQLR